MADITVKVETKIKVKERHTVAPVYLLEFDQEKQLIILGMEGTGDLAYVPLKFWRAINEAVENNILMGEVVP